jgi:hypothetical protein
LSLKQVVKRIRFINLVVKNTMDNDIQKTLLKDLKNAITIDEKVSLIVVFLEYLSENSIVINDLANKFTENSTLTAKAISEILKSIGLLVEKSDETFTALNTNADNINIALNSIIELNDGLNKVQEHLITIYDSINK